MTEALKLMWRLKVGVGVGASERTYPQVSDRKRVPEVGVDHMDQVLSVGGDEGSVIGG